MPRHPDDQHADDEFDRKERIKRRQFEMLMVRRVSNLRLLAGKINALTSSPPPSFVPDRQSAATQLSKPDQLEPADELINEIRKVREKFSRNRESRAALAEKKYAEARKLAAQRDFVQAIDAAKTSISYGSKSVEVFLLLGACYLKTERYGAAVNVLNRAVKAAPGDARTLSIRAIALDNAGKFDDSRRDFVKAAKLEPGNADSQLAAAIAQMRDHDYAASNTSIENALKLQPGSGAAHNLHGRLLLKTGQYDEAADSFRKAIHINDSDADAYLGLSDYYAETQHYEDAVSCLRTAEMLFHQDGDKEGGTLVSRRLTELITTCE